MYIYFSDDSKSLIQTTIPLVIDCDKDRRYTTCDKSLIHLVEGIDFI